MEKKDLPSKGLTEAQGELVKQLRGIGEEIASFYLDALHIIADDAVQAKTNLLAHLAREIDGGLRDVLASKSALNKNLALAPEQVRELKERINEELRSKGLGEIDNISGITLSVCNSLGVEKLDLIQEWIIVSAQFNMFAHRHGATRQPREWGAFRDVWERYERILFRLTGSYYDLLETVLGNFLKKERPTKEVIDALKNLFQQEAREHYFFAKLDEIGWLDMLYSEGFFDPKNSPKPAKAPDGQGYLLPFWSVLGYLERMAQKANDEASQKLILKIVDSIVSYRENEKPIDNPRTKYQLFKILCTIPSNSLEKKHIDFIGESLTSDFHNSLVSADIGKVLLPKLIRDKNKDRCLELLEVITRYSVDQDAKYDKISALVDEYWFADIVEKDVTGLGIVFPEETASILIKRIREIKLADNLSFNNAWIPTIEDHPQHSFPDRFEAVLVRFLRDILLHMPDDEVKPFIKELLADDASILTRIALFIIDRRYDLLKGIFWSIDENLLASWECKHESYELFKNHAGSFDKKEITKIIDWTESNDYLIPEEWKDDSIKVTQYLAYQKKEWYSALLSSKDEGVLKKFEEYNKISPEPIDHPGFVAWSEAWSGEVSPLQELELSELSNSKVVEYLEAFKAESGVRKPSERGLAETLTSAVKTNPHKFSDELRLYRNVPMIYRYALVEGFLKAWDDGKIIDWKAILEYVLDVLKHEPDLEVAGFNYHDWFKGLACRLIEAGTKHDNHAFGEDLIPLAKEILLELNPRMPPGEYRSQDYLTFAINSNQGKYLEALLNLSLRKKRLTKDAWDGEIKAIYEETLQKAPSIELHTLLGHYLANFFYLDKEWAKKNIPLIFSRGGLLTEAALDGYLSGPTVYKEFYFLLKENGIYGAQIREWKNERINEKITAHICLAYAEGWETLEEDGLISKLLEKKESYDYIIDFFSRISEEQVSKYIEKLRALWKRLFELNPEGEILGDLLHWVKYFDSIDEEMFTWLLKGTAFVDEFQDTYVFISSLRRLANADPRNVGELFYSLVKCAEEVPTYKAEDVVYIVEVLYASGEKIVADKICNLYAEKDVHLLKDVYFKNQSR